MRSSRWMFAPVKSLVQIAGTKKANGMQRNLPKSLQNLHLTLAKKALIKVQTYFWLILQDCLTPCTVNNMIVKHGTLCIFFFHYDLLPLIIHCD